MWKIDLESGTVADLLSYRDFAAFLPRSEMQEAGTVHKVNHLMLSPNGQRFMVLYRWFNGERKYTRLITCNVDGTDMYVLSDDDMVSHCFWKDDEHILAFENKKDGGTGYYLMTDRTPEYKHCWSELTGDGHPSYNPDRSQIVTDSYPDRVRIQYLRVMKDEGSKPEVVAKVFSPFKYNNDTRCDLHPRWNHSGDKVCFDSVFEGHRGLYSIETEKKRKKEVDQSLKVTCVIPSYKRCDTVTRAIDSVLAQTYNNIEVCLVDDNVPGDEYSRKLQEVLKKYDGDSRVRYITQEKHVNGAVARNIGIKAAKGEYIGFLDDDDEWLPEKIEKQMKVLQSDPSLDAVTALWVAYLGGKEIRRCAPYTADNLQFKVFLREVAVFTSTVIIRKVAIERFGGFDGTLLRHQDLQFLVDACGVSKFSVLPEYTVKLHTDSEINKPNIEKLIEAKKKFFDSVQNEYKKYTKKERKRIKNAHYYEIAFQAVKAKSYGIAIRYVIKAGISNKSLNDLLMRFKNR